ncbi:hypothetical protein BZA05DRAFT_143690 [Tricharina praecox]|uniref:uncharacterized protein n=1 Tax=Tricharina praecox TaxID=43433 RepID=UPI002220DB21|nr:uncharacterized protein BZA05DRAFT_143690 [Tricharina praecox]KAI5845964.1 hypothetical protein BZA05DRAFT_143690 [Tricharina praecox]
MGSFFRVFSSLFVCFVFVSFVVIRLYLDICLGFSFFFPFFLLLLLPLHFLVFFSLCFLVFVSLCLCVWMSGSVEVSLCV